MDSDQGIDLENKDGILADYGARLVKRLFAGGKTLDQVVNMIVPTAAAAYGPPSQGVSGVLLLLYKKF